MAERNMDMNKCPMPVQDPDVRNKNFDEVALGYTYDMAVNEARRCLNCKNKPEDQCAREWEMLFKTYLPSEKRIATVG